MFSTALLIETSWLFFFPLWRVWDDEIVTLDYGERLDVKWPLTSFLDQDAMMYETCGVILFA